MRHETEYHRKSVQGIICRIQDHVPVKLWLYTAAGLVQSASHRDPAAAL